MFRYHNVPPEKLPMEVASIHFEKDWTLEKIIEKLQEIPGAVFELYLDNNALGLKTYEILKAIFEALPVQLIHLSLSNNQLDAFKDIEEFSMFFKRIPKIIRSLSLSENKLGYLQTHVLIRMLHSFHDNIESLDFSDNRLDLLCEPDGLDKLDAILFNLPKNVKTLDLGAITYAL